MCYSPSSSPVVFPPVSPPNRRGGGAGGGGVGGGRGALHHLLLPLIVACRTPTCLSPCSWSTLHHPQHPPIFNCHPSTCLSASSMLLLHPLQSVHLRVVLATTSPALLPPVSPSTRGRGSHIGWADLPPLHCPRQYLTCYTPICLSCPCSSHYHLSLSPPVCCPRHYPTCHTPTCLSTCLWSPLHRLLHSLIFNCHPSTCLSACSLLPLHPLHSPHLCVVLATTTPVTLPSVSPLVCGRHCITCYTPSSSAATHLPVSPPVRCCHCVPSTPPICALSSTLYTLYPICHIPTCLSTCPWSPLYSLPHSPVRYCLSPCVGGRFCTDC